MGMSRNFLILRSVAFAIVTKLSGAAMVFIALPVISHSASPADYEAFLTTMNIASVAGLVFTPFMILGTRELAHAFVSEHYDLDKAIQSTFGTQLIVTLIVAGGIAFFFLFSSHFVAPKSAMLLGLTLTLAQLAAGWAEAYRVANRSDYVTSVLQTLSNVIMVSLLLALAHYGMTIMPICLIYFGMPALAQFLLFCHLVFVKGVHVRLETTPIGLFRKKIYEALPLSLIPAVDYMKIYLSSLLVLLLSGSASYVLYYTGILYIARLINPLTLITRPLMPAYIDAINRNDIRWLGGLKKILLGLAASGALMALALPFLLTPRVLSFAFPPEIRSISIFYIVLACLFAYGHALVSLLSPLYIGGHRASFYGLANLAFTAAALAIGALFCTAFGALAMMGSLACATAACGVFLLVGFISKK